MTCRPFADLGLFNGVSIGPVESAEPAFALPPGKVYNIVCGKNCSLPEACSLLEAYNLLAPLVGLDRDPAFIPHERQYSAHTLPLSRAKYYLAFIPAVESAAGPVRS